MSSNYLRYELIGDSLAESCFEQTEPVRSLLLSDRIVSCLENWCCLCLRQSWRLDESFVQTDSPVYGWLACIFVSYGVN